MLEYWLSKTNMIINSFSPFKRIIPVFRLSIIPIPQKIALRNNGITPRIEEAPVFFLLAISVYLC